MPEKDDDKIKDVKNTPVDGKQTGKTKLDDEELDKVQGGIRQIGNGTGKDEKMGHIML